MPTRIQIKRVYEPNEPEDGYRVLVDRLWPRGVTKAALPMNAWCKTLTPSTELRQWFNHQDTRLETFAKQYRDELEANRTAAIELLNAAEDQTLTLLYAAKDPTCNHARVLRDWLLELISSL